MQNIQICLVINTSWLPWWKAATPSRIYSPAQAGKYPPARTPVICSSPNVEHKLMPMWAIHLGSPLEDPLGNPAYLGVISGKICSLTKNQKSSSSSITREVSVH